MTHRYSLRFESGERAGEVVPITGAVFTVGRKPGNSLQIVENSVSGKHAELRIEGGGLQLKDLGSTNGTRVAGERIVEAELRGGTSLSIGNVALTLLDTESADQSGAAQSGADQSDADQSASPESPRVVSAENLARARGRGSKTGLILMALIAAAGGGAYWWLTKGGGGGGSRQRPVVAVAGNLLAKGYSFEASAGWEEAEDLPVVFQAGARARYSGSRGLGASLEGGESAEHASPLVNVSRVAGLVVGARLRVTDEARARIGLRFLPPEGVDPAPGNTTVWSAPHTDSSGWLEVELTASVPGGYTRAQVLVRAEAAETTDGGRVDLDDVSLVTGEGGPAGRFGEFRLFHDGGTTTLFKVDRVLLSGIGVRTGQMGQAATGLAMESGGARLDHGARGPATLVLRAEAPLLAGGFATLGQAGYFPRDGEFEAEGVTDILLGRDQDLVRIALGNPTTLQARRVGSGLELRAKVDGAGTTLIQLDFQEERRRVIELTTRAEDAERAGDWGRCLGLWQELLDQVPFEAVAVARAQEARARLLQAGFEETNGLAEEIGRARFFRLVDLFRQCRERAAEISSRYVGSEVDDKARELIAGIDQDLVGLEADIDHHEVVRLRAVLAGLQAQEATELASLVERYLQEQYGEGH
jgi:pSer/pThr/pTyr-binding forkhead associated (FHA) protein